MGGKHSRSKKIPKEHQKQQKTSKLFPNVCVPNDAFGKASYDRRSPGTRESVPFYRPLTNNQCSIRGSSQESQKNAPLSSDRSDEQRPCRYIPAQTKTDQASSNVAKGVSNHPLSSLSADDVNRRKNPSPSSKVMKKSNKNGISGNFKDLRDESDERSTYAPSVPVLEYDFPPEGAAQNIERSEHLSQRVESIPILSYGREPSRGTTHNSPKRSSKVDGKKSTSPPTTRRSGNLDAHCRKGKKSNVAGKGDEPPKYEEVVKESKSKNEMIKQTKTKGKIPPSIRSSQCDSKEIKTKKHAATTDTQNSTNNIEELNDLIKKEFGSIGGATLDLKGVDMTDKPFPGRNRLFIWNLPPNTSRNDLENLLSRYSEITVDFMDNNKRGCCVRLKYQARAAQQDLDGFVFRGRSLRVHFDNRFAQFRVLNLAPWVTNELLKKAFTIFGEVENAEVLVDEEGEPKGEGYLEFAHKRGGERAFKACKQSCFALTASLQPVILEKINSNGGKHGYPETHLPRNNPDYLTDRQIGPRFVSEGSTDFKYAMMWKELLEKKRVLQEELAIKFQDEENRIRSQVDSLRKSQEMRSRSSKN